MQIRRSMPFSHQICQSSNVFVQIREINVTATVTSNFAQIVKKVTCYEMNSLTLDELINIPTKAEERSMVQVSFLTQDQT